MKNNPITLIIPKIANIIILPDVQTMKITLELNKRSSYDCRVLVEVVNEVKDLL